MEFQTFGYFLFLLGVTAAYYLLPHRWRWVLLLAASYWFYACWNAVYALLMLLSTGITYFSGLLMEGAQQQGGSQGQRMKKRWLAVSLVSNLAILFAFKYANMFLGSLGALLSVFGVAAPLPRVEWLLPVGISFYTFQALGYSIDVYRGKLPAVRHFGKYALFVSFFPQLVAGPIERSAHLLPQFDDVHRPDFHAMREGSLRILTGLLKKLLLADRLAAVVNLVYNSPADYGAPAIIVATGCFAFQIYCDFSGYSDIAVGSAALLGFRLMRNFDRPYLSRSVNDFWRRWHISLSSWFRDYLYIPLGGSRVSMPRWALNTLVVFGLSGLWHGADWTFVIWGLLNGLFILAGRLSRPLRGRLGALLHIDPKGRLQAFSSTACTFALVCFAWMFFRANAMSDMGVILRRLCSSWEFSSLGGLFQQIGRWETLATVGFLLVFVCGEIGWQKHQGIDRIVALPLPLRWTICLGLLFLLILFGKYNETQTFLYFQF